MTISSGLSDSVKSFDSLSNIRMGLKGEGDIRFPLVEIGVVAGRAMIRARVGGF